MKRPLFGRKLISFFILQAFLLTSIISPVRYVSAQELLQLPPPGIRVNLSSACASPLLKGVHVYPNHPLKLDFLLDKGDSSAATEDLKLESSRLIKYFMAALTVPDKDFWVNLSPYERDRIVPESFGQTGMGRDLLAQDYLLKQIVASVIYPEEKIGKEVWDKIYAQVQRRFGTTDIPLETFNKVWIVPSKAVVYENKNSAYVVESRLKVMLESDYLALSSNVMPTGGSNLTQASYVKDVIREVVIPILEKEVNEGSNFTQLRQVYSSLILATWYKHKIKDTILGQVYVDRQKILGIDIVDKNEKEKIWQQYVEAFKKGSYNYIKEEKDAVSGEYISRKYFSGGIVFTLGDKLTTFDSAMSWPNIVKKSLMIITASLLWLPANVQTGQPRDGLPVFNISESDQRGLTEVANVISMLAGALDSQRPVSSIRFVTTDNTSLGQDGTDIDRGTLDGPHDYFTFFAGEDAEGLADRVLSQSAGIFPYEMTPEQKQMIARELLQSNGNDSLVLPLSVDMRLDVAPASRMASRLYLFDPRSKRVRRIADVASEYRGKPVYIHIFSPSKEMIDLHKVPKVASVWGDHIMVNMAGVRWALRWISTASSQARKNGLTAFTFPGSDKETLHDLLLRVIYHEWIHKATAEISPDIIREQTKALMNKYDIKVDEGEDTYWAGTELAIAGEIIASASPGRVMLFHGRMAAGALDKQVGPAYKTAARIYLSEIYQQLAKKNIVRGQARTWDERAKELSKIESGLLKQTVEEFLSSFFQEKLPLFDQISGTVGKVVNKVANKAISVSKQGKAVKPVPRPAKGGAKSSNDPHRKGGIDLTPKTLAVQSVNQGESTMFYLEPEMLRKMQDSPGISPVIIGVRSLENFSDFFGVQDIVVK